ncbi:MAG: type II toxin-antitoxin system RelE/ParE family toxin [Chthoniobacterales bacterium]
MPCILRTTQSRYDYDEIWDYIAQDNPDAADEMMLLFDKQLLVIATSPDIGKLRLELSPNLRSFPVDNYLIFYHPIENGIELLRVLHGARDIHTKFFR